MLYVKQNMLMNNKLRFKVPTAVLTVMSLFPVLSTDQVQPEQADLPIISLTRTEVVESFFRRLNDSYILPEVAAQIEKSIRSRIQKDEYNQISFLRR